MTTSEIIASFVYKQPELLRRLRPTTRWSNRREKLDVLKQQNDVIQNRSKIEAEIERNIDRHLRDIEAKMVVFGSGVDRVADDFETSSRDNLSAIKGCCIRDEYLWAQIRKLRQDIWAEKHIRGTWRLTPSCAMLCSTTCW
ncbi:conserved hypothetical protein [Culex quinquefasciatus]|uniref:Uncharacterized protein n=1 Tax=Culex quinquefasciatus TaxID=7176 RepID=B0X9C4_CULQU|nr:conserved hypothetical protein [Culex quinquefasciatus]|eukprot:XP_001866246.1 conserved hypothetical protein [Culex quinquefasciatus]